MENNWRGRPKKNVLSPSVQTLESKKEMENGSTSKSTKSSENEEQLEKNLEEEKSSRDGVTSTDQKNTMSKKEERPKKLWVYVISRIRIPANGMTRVYSPKSSRRCERNGN